MSCSNPIAAATLADYWLAILPQPEEEAVEEHLFSCDQCGLRLREMIALAAEIANLARAGTLRLVASDAFLERAAAQGMRVRQYALPAGGSVNCTVTAQDDLLIARLAANLSEANQVDLYFCDERGVERFRLPDIPIDSRAGSVVYQESIAFAKAAPDHTAIARLVTFDESGSERLLGQYTFNHKRSLPGPAAK